MSQNTRFLEFAQPFFIAARNVFKTMIADKIETQKPSFKTDTHPLGDISATVGLNGVMNRDGVNCPYKGMLVLSFPLKTYLGIAGVMFGKTFTTYEADIHDLGAEVVNMIMGNAKKDLFEMGYSSNMAIPSIIVGKEYVILYPSGTKVILIPINTAHGIMYMELCYSEG